MEDEGKFVMYTLRMTKAERELMREAYSSTDNPSETARQALVNKAQEILSEVWKEKQEAA